MRWLMFVAAILCFMDSAFKALGSQLVDRLLVEINHIAYSQRQMELYLACKDAMASEQTVRSSNHENWRILLNEFSADMMIEQEALRLGSFDPTRRMLAKGIELVEGRRKQQGVLDQILARLDADPQSLSRSVTQALRVEGYRRSKQRQAAISDDRRATNLSAATRFSSWQKDIEERAVLRHFAESKEYRPVQAINDKP